MGHARKRLREEAREERLQRGAVLDREYVVPCRHLAILEQRQLVELIPPRPIDANEAFSVQQEDGIVVAMKRLDKGSERRPAPKLRAGPRSSSSIAPRRPPHECLRGLQCV